MAFDKAYREKQIDHPFERKAFIDAYGRSILYFDGQAWVSHPAKVSPAPSSQPKPHRPH